MTTAEIVPEPSDRERATAQSEGGRVARNSARSTAHREAIAARARRWWTMITLSALFAVYETVWWTRALAERARVDRDTDVETSLASLRSWTTSAYPHFAVTLVVVAVLVTAWFRWVGRTPAPPLLEPGPEEPRRRHGAFDGTAPLPPRIV